MVVHNRYTPEYKLEAVRLARTEGISDTARNLGINPNMLGRWKKEHETRAAEARPVFTSRGVSALTEQKRELQQLRRDLEIACLLDPERAPDGQGRRSETS